MTLIASLRIGPQGHVALPVALRKAAGLDEGSELVARVEGIGRVVLESRASARARVWAGAPRNARPPSDNDVRVLRAGDTVVSDDVAVQRSASTTTSDAGAALLRRLGL